MQECQKLQDFSSCGMSQMSNCPSILLGISFCSGYPEYHGTGYSGSRRKSMKVALLSPFIHPIVEPFVGGIEASIHRLA